MAARLVSLTDAPSIPIDKPVIFIGRDSECDVVLNDSRRVSRKHCCLAHVNNHLLVRDLGSMNGVWINGQRVERTGTMRPGDELAIGDVRFRLSVDDGSSPEEGEEGEEGEDPSAAVVDVSQDFPVIVSASDDDVLVAEPAAETDSSELLVLPEVPLLEDDDGDIISLDDDDSKILPLSG